MQRRLLPRLHPSHRIPPAELFPMPALVRPAPMPVRLSSCADLPIVGGYALVQRLASGTWCEVYRARPLSMKEAAADYVIKTVRPGVNDREFAAALLQREATVAAE